MSFERLIRPPIDAVKHLGAYVMFYVNKPSPQPQEGIGASITFPPDNEPGGLVA